MMEDVGLDSDSLSSLEHCKIAVKYFFLIFNKTPFMGHVHKILEKNPKIPGNRLKFACAVL